MAPAAVTFLMVAAGKVSRGKVGSGVTERSWPAGIAAIIHGVSLKHADCHLRRTFREFEA